MERLDKIISSQTDYSRSDVKKLIKLGKVEVNDILIKEVDYKIDENKDIIKLEGKELKIIDNIYLVLNKPKGFISSRAENNRNTVLDLIPNKYKFKKIFPAGRLDIDTTGLLIITSDGMLTHEILSPNKHVKKVYEVTIDIKLTNEMKEGFFKGVELIDGKCKSALLEIIDDYNCLVTLREGRYHQIKRMFGCFGAKVVELKRIQMGNYKMPKDLREGECRELTEQDLNKLKEKE